MHDSKHTEYLFVDNSETSVLSKNNSYGNIEFVVNDRQIPILKIAPDGTIFYNGNIVKEDIYIYNGLKEFLISTGYYGG